MVCISPLALTIWPMPTAAAHSGGIHREQHQHHQHQHQNQNQNQNQHQNQHQHQHQQSNRSSLVEFARVRGLERSGTNLMQVILDNCGMSLSCGCKNHLTDGKTALTSKEQSHTPCWKHFIPPEPLDRTGNGTHGHDQSSIKSSSQCGSSKDRKLKGAEKIYSVIQVPNLAKLDDITGYNNPDSCGGTSSGSERPMIVVVIKNVFHWVLSICNYHSRACKSHNTRGIRCLVSQWNTFTRQFLRFHQEAPHRVKLVKYEDLVVRPQQAKSSYLTSLTRTWSCVLSRPFLTSCAFSRAKTLALIAA